MSDPIRNHAINPCADSVVEEVVVTMRKRAAYGFAKYGTTLDRTDLSPLDWLQHAIEESMDRTVYLVRLRRDVAALIAERDAAVAKLQSIAVHGAKSP